jgi:hypothetical protein
MPAGAARARRRLTSSTTWYHALLLWLDVLALAMSGLPVASLVPASFLRFMRAFMLLPLQVL